MGISYQDLPKWVQSAAKLLPVTYINRDFYKIWTGETYNYIPMLQSYLFLGAVSGILLFLALRGNAGIGLRSRMHGSDSTFPCL